MFSVTENSLNFDTVNLDALSLVKLIFGEIFLSFRLKSRRRFIAIATVLGRKSRSGARESHIMSDGHERVNSFSELGFCCEFLCMLMLRYLLRLGNADLL